MFKRFAGLLVSALVPILFLSQLIETAEPAPSAAAPHDVIINEWSQGDSGSREWVELLVVNGPLDMRGWDLGDSVPGDLAFSGDNFWSHMPAGSRIVIYNGGARDPLLPSDDLNLGDCAVVIPHNHAALFSGSWPLFSNATAGDNPHLRDGTGATIHDFSMEPGTSLHPGQGKSVRYDGDSAAGVATSGNWTVVTAAAATPGGGNGDLNSAWADTLCAGSAAPNLSLMKSGPLTATTGAMMVYTITVGSTGQLAAPAVRLTDTLPTGVTFVADDSGLAPAQPITGTLVWDLGTLLTGTQMSFNLTVTIGIQVQGLVTNVITAATTAAEPVTADNTASAVTLVQGSGPVALLIDAVLYDGQENELDEAVHLRNVGETVANIGGWQLNDGETRTAVIPAGALLLPGQAVWLTKDGSAFLRQFGFPPDFEAAGPLTDSVPNLSGSWPTLANTGDQVMLLDETGALVDCLVYGAGAPADCSPGWSGAAVQPYQVSNLFAQEGQILYRMRDQATGQVVADTDTAADWAQSLGDVINGRKVRYPGWDLDSFYPTARLTETAVLTVAIAPDNAYQMVVDAIDSAASSIQIETLTFENLAIADALVAALGRGVTVTVLLEGGPSGGISDQGRYICQQLEAAGGQCWFMINDATADIYDRYRFLHAKFILIDETLSLISSENLSANSLPGDDKRDGTWGRRGVVLATDAPGVAAHLKTLFALDLDPANHLDLFRWQEGHSVYGAPPAGYVPITQSGGVTYAIRFAAPTPFTGTLAFELVQSPENSLHDQMGLLGLISRAGAGDTILVEQLDERPHWGDMTSNAAADPNPRLEAYIEAARRGADVRLLLDSFFADPANETGNYAACEYVNSIGRTEALSLTCTLGNPAGLGIHNKMVLAEIGGLGYIHVGSINGTEQSNKGNRELALQVQSNGAYALLADMFAGDWPRQVFLPVVLNQYVGPAGHLLISEILYDPAGQDDAEFIELANPTGVTIDLSHNSLGDAVHQSDYEDVRRFPLGTLLAPGQTLVVATSATAFKAKHGFAPDFEILSTDALVPDLIDDPSWGNPAAFLQLGNSGDEVILRDTADGVVDVVTYGQGSYPGVIGCSLAPGAGYSLERNPFWRDTDDCTADFRAWPFPSPGQVP